MSGQFPRKFVLRVHLMTGLAELGWDTDLPESHYRHETTVCVIGDHEHPSRPESPCYQDFLAAEQRQKQINEQSLREREHQHRRQGYLPVGIDYHHGCFEGCWAALNGEQVLRMEPMRFPGRALTALEQAVYIAKVKQELAQNGHLCAGRVYVDQSGAWFIPKSKVPS